MARKKRIELPSSGNLDADGIPAIPQKAGFMAQWEGLADADLTNILFDMTFEAQYTAYRATIQSRESRENGRPILLVEGAFTDKAAVSVAESEGTPALNKNERLLEVWDIAVSEAGTTARFLLPENADAASVKLQVQDGNGNWNEVPFRQDGSYLVFELSQLETTIALVQTVKSSIAVYAVGVCVLLAAIAAILGRKKVILSKKK